MGIKFLCFIAQGCRRDPPELCQFQLQDPQAAATPRHKSTDPLRLQTTNADMLQHRHFMLLIDNTLQIILLFCSSSTYPPAHSQSIHVSAATTKSFASHCVIFLLQCRVSQAIHVQQTQEWHDRYTSCAHNSFRSIIYTRMRARSGRYILILASCWSSTASAKRWWVISSPAQRRSAKTAR